MARSVLRVCNDESGSSQDSDNEIQRRRCGQLDESASDAAVAVSNNSKLNDTIKMTTLAAYAVSVHSQSRSKHNKTNEECVENKVTRLTRKFNTVCLKEETELVKKPSGPSPSPSSSNSNDKRHSHRTRTTVTNSDKVQVTQIATDDDCRVRKTIRLFEIDSNGDGVEMSGLRSIEGTSGRVAVSVIKARENKAIDNDLVLARNRLKPLIKVERENASTRNDIDTYAKVSDRDERTETEAEDQLSSQVRRRRYFSMFANNTPTRTYASFDVKTLKNRPLSVAQPASLEDTLSDAPPPQQRRTAWPIADDNRVAKTIISPSPSPSPPLQPLPLNKNSSFLHRCKTFSSYGPNVSSIDASGEPDYGYSNIYDGSGESESDSRYRISWSNNDSANVYDTVLYSELNIRVENGQRERADDRYYRDGDGDGDDDDESSYDSDAAYEVVSSLLRGDGQTAAVAHDSGSSNSSNSSVEKANSLYETKETETATATANITDTTWTACSSASAISDDWSDINERESSDQMVRNNRIVIAKKRRMRIGAAGRKLKKMKRKKFRTHQNQPKISICAGPATTNSTIYIADDYGDGQRHANENSHQCARAESSGSVTVLRSVLYLSPSYEAQEVSTSFSNSDYSDDSAAVAATYEKESARGDYLAEEICDDFDDSSSEENDYTSNSCRSSPLVSRASEKSFLPNVNVHVQSQNIYEFMKKARKTVRKSWSSFNQQMRRSSASNTSASATNIAVGSINANKASVSAAARNNSCSLVGGGGSVRWTSFKTKLRPKYGTVSAANSSSIFYVNPEDLRFDRDDRNPSHVDANANVTLEKSSFARRKTTHLDTNQSKPRPSSPPPPPPPLPLVATTATTTATATVEDDADKLVWLGEHNDDNDADVHVRLDANYVSSSPLSSSNSDFNLSSCSDLRLRFADEPLYQFYAESVAQLSGRYSNDSSDGYEEIGSLTSRPSAMELITPSPNGHGQCRSLWCEVDEVKNSGILEKLSISRQKLQEAKFEVITSEASYYKSLSVLDRIFVNDTRLRDEKLLCKNDWKILFGNVAAVRKCSQIVLSDLEKCWQQDIMLTGLGNVVLEHTSTNFKIFVKYCSNQIYIDRTLKKLRQENVNFVELINKLEADAVCQSLSLHSFLMLPMQRITRMPLLVDAILSKLEPIDDLDHSHLTTFKTTLAKLNKIVKDCNESARKFERYEEMLLLSRQLEFSRKQVKMFSVASSSRWLVRSGPLVHLNPPDAKLTITRKLTKSVTKLYFFLFNDVLVIAKKKSDDNYAVVDYCLRNVMQLNAVEDAPVQPSMSSSSCSLSPSPSPSPSLSSSLASLYSPHRYLLILTMLENHEGKTVEMVLSCDSDSTRQRWLEASYSRLTSDNPEEKLYEEWDCPQVLAVHAYPANQPDELCLQNGDVVKVLKKTTDGWYHGERIRDGIIGWFPGNYTIEIASQHTRAKNLKLRHRLLTLSADYLQNHLQQN